MDSKLWIELDDDINLIEQKWARFIFKVVIKDIKKMNLISIPTFIQTKDPGIEIRSAKVGIFSIQYDSENNEGFYFAFSSADEKSVIKGHIDNLITSSKDALPLLFPIGGLFCKFMRERQVK